MERRVRVRFAPSPTGPLHMGGVRTALYNYLFAKKNNGDFILRIEDTDQTRFVPGAENYILEALAWCGFQPDEGPQNPGKYAPYKQSERKHLYKQYADQLLEAGLAYYAFDTPEELNEMRDRLKAAKVASPQYNAITRNSMKNSLTLSEDEVKNRLDNGDPYVIRIKIPRNEEVRFHDEIRGWVVVHSSHLDDKVLFKSDGMPTYHLANIVDDHLMEITHVIRGEEWLPSAPLHILLYRYLGWVETMPKLAHLPLILKPDGNGKLSKRDGDRLGFPVFPLQWEDPENGSISSGYREKGYFPEAFVNSLAFLGWNPGTEQELFKLDELVEAFSLERVGKAGAKYDADKTKWYNQQYLRKKSNQELADLLAPIIEKTGWNTNNIDLLAYVDLMKERAVFVEDMLEGSYFFESPTSYDEKTISKKWKDNSAEIVNKLIEVLNNIQDFTTENIEKDFKAFLEKESLGFGAVLPIFRVFITGLGMGPSMFAICSLLGKEESLKRLNVGLEKMHGK
jgi:glutamyl-tRNA synthetase